MLMGQIPDPTAQPQSNSPTAAVPGTSPAADAEGVATAQPATAPASSPTTTGPPGDVSSPPVETATPTLEPKPLPNHEAPLHLRIPSIGVDAVVQWVGLDDQGRMGVPTNYSDVAWYQPGAKPGNIGNAVIDGHLDSVHGPAVFYRLSDLQPGAEIFVVTSDGTELRFVVDEIATYMTDNVPLTRVFGPAVGSHLNLITCGGLFDWGTRSYDERLVVYATLRP